MSSPAAPAGSAPVPAPAPVPAGAAPKASGSHRRPSPVALSWVAALLLALALAFGNAAIARTNVRLDLTQDKLYTLSAASRKIVAALTDPCRIRVFWGDKIPGEAEPVRRRLEGLLDEYAAASDGRISVTWVKMDKEGEAEAQAKNVYEGTFQVFSANEVSAVKAFHGLVILYEDRIETLGPLAESDGQTYQISTNLEYEVSSAIYKISRTRKAVVGVVTESGPPSYRNPRGDNRFSMLTSQVLEKVYGNDLRTSVNLDDPVAPEITTLLVLEPKDWSDKRVYNLEQFVLRGGKALLLLDTADVKVAWGGQPQTRTGLEDWLGSFGVQVLTGVVADFDPTAMGAALTQEGRGTKYPFWPRLRAEHIDQENPGTRGIDSVPLYFPVEILADPEAQKTAGRILHVLATTSEKGWRKDSTSGLQSLEEPEGKALGKQPVMVSIEGPFTSFWKGKPAPGETPPPAPVPPAPAAGAMGEPVVPPAATPSMGDEPVPAMGAEAPKAPEPPKAPEAPKAPEPSKAPDAPKAPETPKAPEPAPVPSGPKGPEGEEGAPGAPKPPAPPRLDTGKGVIVILGDADLVSDDFSGVPRRDITGGATQFWNGVQGFFFVSNVVDWLTGSDDLIALRARGARSRKFDEIESSKAGQIKLVNYAAAPLLVLLGGLFYFVVRKNRR